MNIDWNEQAAKAARYVSEEMQAALRGAMKWHRQYAVVFGNDGDPDEPESIPAVEVEMLRNMLQDLPDRAEEVGFAKHHDTWAMIVKLRYLRPDSVKDLHDSVWQFWHCANVCAKGLNNVTLGDLAYHASEQQKIAAKAIAFHQPD